DHPGILLIIAAITLIRWLIQKRKGEAQNTESAPPPPPSQPITRGGETRTEEERIRKFLEALGQPAGSAPPKVAPRRAVQPKIFPRLPRLTTAPPPLPEAPEIRTPVPPPLPIELAATRGATDPDFEVREVARQTSSEPLPEIRRAGLGRFKLGTPQDLRTAIVLREIFGPPRSLQPLDPAI
ncbi:MAG: hypothetical protein M3Z85_15855, partial [Acidobacteriota bacterium]|nr:hypothetical protein [Acidobacteriota bacterium]